MVFYDFLSLLGFSICELLPTMLPKTGKFLSFKLAMFVVVAFLFFCLLWVSLLIKAAL